MEFDIKITISFTLTSPKWKTCINLAKYIQDPYEVNYIGLMNKIEEQLNKWRDSPCAWIGGLSIIIDSSSQFDLGIERNPN